MEKQSKMEGGVSHPKTATTTVLEVVHYLLQVAMIQLHGDTCKGQEVLVHIDRLQGKREKLNRPLQRK